MQKNSQFSEEDLQKEILHAKKLTHLIGKTIGFAGILASLLTSWISIQQSNYGYLAAKVTFIGIFSMDGFLVSE